MNLIGNIDILADANGGAGATGGNATSGFASVNNSGVSMTISDDPNGGTSLNVSSVSTGGAGSVATGNAASVALVDESVRNDPGVYPPPEVKAKLFPDLAESEEFTRLLNRSWTRFTTGQ